MGPTPLSQAAIDAWQKVPAGSFLELKLGKAEIEELYRSLSGVIQAQKELQQSLIEYSNSNYGNANSHLRNSQEDLLEAQSRLNRFMSALMYAIGRDFP